jgi:hypothetical protein
VNQLVELARLQYGGTGLLQSPALTNTTTTLSFGAFNFFVNGASFRKAAAAVALTATTHDVAQDTWASFRVSIAANGTVTITKAADQVTEALAHSTLAAVPANEANMGYFVVRGGTAAIFDATTNNLQSGGVTGMVVTFYSVAPSVVQPTSLT